MVFPCRSVIYYLCFKKSFVWFFFGLWSRYTRIDIYFIVIFFFEFCAPRVYRMDALHPRAPRVEMIQAVPSSVAAESQAGMWDIYIYLPAIKFTLIFFLRKRYLLKSLGV